MCCPGCHRCPSKASLDRGWQGQCHQPLQVALTMSSLNNPRKQTEKVKGSEVKIRPDSEASVKDTNPAQLGRCQGRKCSGGGSPLGASSSLGKHCCVPLIAHFLILPCMRSFLLSPSSSHIHWGWGGKQIMLSAANPEAWGGWRKGG